MWRAQWTGLLDGAVHDGDVGAQADGVGGAVGVEPFLGVDLVGAEQGPHVVVEDLGRGAGKGGEAGVHEASQVVGEGFAEALGAFGDLERGEAVDVDAGGGFLHGSGDVDVVVAVEVGVDAALEADLGGTEIPGLLHPARDLVEREQVGVAAQVERQRTLREPAEPALERAHVRVVDVAVLDPGDDVADCLASHVVGDLGDGGDLGAPGPEQGDDLVDAELLAEQRAGEDLADRTAGRGPARHEHRRRIFVTGVPVVVAAQAPRRRSDRAPGTAATRRGIGRGGARTPGRWSAGGPARSRAPR